jgi:hypothetical protein
MTRAHLGAAMLLISCSTPSAPTTPWPPSSGVHADEGELIVREAWTRVIVRFPGATLPGWQVVWVRDLFRWPDALCGTTRCGDRPLAGLTLWASRQIILSWGMPPARRVAVAAWELCNAWRRAGDEGCS